MKVQQETNDNIEYIGEIKENKVGIDRQNIDFIATLLTSNLYSNPFESFLRETISNAYDSHVEAKTDQPIILMISGKNTYNYRYGKEPYDVSIRDYGVGISPERFQKIYTNIGSSTKRESNAYIGGWGIGRFAALSCSDNVQINSYYNGVKYSYIMYKNGTGINIDKISETPGEYKQGVEICINNIELDIDTLRAAISKLVFFDNLVIHSNGIQNSRLNNYISGFNERKINKFTNLASSDYDYIDNGVYAKVGNVLYEINKNVLSHKLFDRCYNFIAVECPIGSVNVTPNREQLQYTDKTINKLKEALDKASAELTQIAMKKAMQNFDSINAAFNFYVHSNDLRLAPRISFNIPTLLNFSDLIINGSKIPKCVWPIIQDIRYDDIPEFIISDIYNKAYRMMKKHIRLSGLLEHHLAIKYDDRIKQVTKSYYCDTVAGSSIVIKKSDISNLLKHIVHRATRNKLRSKTEVLRALSFILKNYKYKTLENDKVPANYIANFKAINTKKKETTDKIEIRRYNRDLGYHIYSLESYLKYYVFQSNSKKKLRDNMHLIVYAPNTKDDDFIRKLAYEFYDKKIEFITLKKEHIPFLPKSKLFINLEDFLTLYQKIIAKAATVKYLEDKYGQYYGMMALNSRTNFRNYQYKYGISTTNEDILKLLDQYQEKKWLDWAAVIKFSLSDNDIKRLMQRQTLQHLDNIADSLLYIIKGRYSKDDKFGIEPNKKTILLLTKLLGK